MSLRGDLHFVSRGTRVLISRAIPRQATDYLFAYLLDSSIGACLQLHAAACRGWTSVRAGGQMKHATETVRESSPEAPRHRPR
jgi:hypothetical protein